MSEGAILEVESMMAGHEATGSRLSSRSKGSKLQVGPEAMDPQTLLTELYLPR